MILFIAALQLFALAVYLFIHFIIKKDKGHKEPIGALFVAMGFGILAVVIVIVLNEFLVPKTLTEYIATGKNAEVSVKLLLTVLTIGVVEEGAKCLPLALFIYKRKYFDELTDGVIYFGITALTFGIIEDIIYALSYGGGTGIFRILFSPYLHAGFTILFGICLAYRKVLNKSWLFVLTGFVAAVWAHALYDFFALMGGVGLIMTLLITLTLNILLFVVFKKAQSGDEARGQSSLGANKFCQFCGKPNSDRTLFCSFCGRRT
jgi:RsiW-degrading membrane proteinase PrsW (M82 family)